MKNKKIPNTPKYLPKYEFGDIFNLTKKEKQNQKKAFKQAGTAAYGVGEGLLDTVTMGATDQLTDQGYSALQRAGNSTQDEMREQDSIRGFGNAAGAIGGAFLNPSATGTAISQTGKGLGAGVSKGNESKDWAQTAGMALNTAGQIGAMAYGQAGSPMSSGMQTQAGNFNASGFGQGLSKYNEFANQGGGNGQMGGMLSSIIGGFGGAGRAGGKNPYGYVTGGSGAGFKYGGQMKYAMGGMNMRPNAEVENNEMITSDTPPQVFNNGGVELVSNNPYGTPTYKTNGASHDTINPDGTTGIPIKMEPGSIINGKTVNPLTGNKFTKDINNLANMENKYTKKAEAGDKYSKTNAKLILPILAQKKDYLNNLQNAIVANKEQAKALRNGQLPQAPMDNQQMSPQGMPGQPQGEMPMIKYGGRFAMGGVQLPYYNTDNAGNPIYEMGGGYPAMTNPYHNFKGSIPMYEDGGNMPLDPPTSNGTTPVKQGTIHVPLKKSEVPGYSKTGFDQSNSKVKDRKIDLYKNPDYLIQHPEIGGAKWNDFQTFLQSYKLPTGENYIGNEAANTKLANDYTNLAMSDYNKSLSNKYKNDPDAAQRRSINLGDIEQVQTYYNQGDPNVKVDKILGGETSQFRYPHWASVSKYKAKKGEYMPITYGGKQYVVDADIYNNKIAPIWEGKSDENVTQYFQPYDYKKHMMVDQGNVDIVNRLNTQGGSGVFTKKSYQPPPFIFRNGQGSMDEQKRAYNKANGLADDFGFKYGGQMPMPKFWDGGPYIDPSETGMQEQADMNTYYDNLNQINSANNTGQGFKVKGMEIPSNSPLKILPKLDFSKYGINSGKLNLKQPSNEDLRRQTFGTSSGSETLPDADLKSKNFDWGNLAKQGANFLGQNMGNIYDLTRKDAPLQSYERATGKFLDPTQARRDEQYAYRQTNKAIPGLVGGSAGAAMNLLGANRAKTSTNIGRINKEYENANAQIGNQLNQYNTEIAYREAEARAKDAAMKENIRSQAIHGIGTSVGKATKSGKQDEMDQKTLEMYKQYYNNPQFRAALKKAGYDV